MYLVNTKGSISRHKHPPHPYYTSNERKSKCLIPISKHTVNIQIAKNGSPGNTNATCFHRYLLLSSYLLSLCASVGDFCCSKDDINHAGMTMTRIMNHAIWYVKIFDFLAGRRRRRSSYCIFPNLPRNHERKAATQRKMSLLSLIILLQRSR